MMMVTPPNEYSEQVSVPVLNGNTNGDLWLYKNELESALDQCNLKLLKMREYSDAMKEGSKKAQ